MSENNGKVHVLQFAVVVGKMRSGTSAVAEVLHMMGCAMGNWFVAPQPPAWRSDWEDADFNRLTFSKMPFGSTKVSLPEQELQMRVDSLYTDYLVKRRATYDQVAKVRGLCSGCIGVKHPFLLFVLPQFKQTLLKLGYQPVVIATRRPEYMIRRSAAPTIDQKRGGKETQEALGQLLNTYDYDYVVDYERLTQKPEKTVRELATLVGITGEDNIQRGISAVKQPTKYTLVEQGA